MFALCWGEWGWRSAVIIARTRPARHPHKWACGSCCPIQPTTHRSYVHSQNQAGISVQTTYGQSDRPHAIRHSRGVWIEASVDLLQLSAGTEAAVWVY